jgi:hypothetical protein
MTDSCTTQTIAAASLYVNSSSYRYYQRLSTSR